MPPDHTPDRAPAPSHASPEEHDALRQLRDIWQSFGLGLPDLPSGWIDRQREIRRRKARHAAIERFVLALAREGNKAIKAGLLTDPECSGITSLVMSVGQRLELERAALESRDEIARIARAIDDA